MSATNPTYLLPIIHSNRAKLAREIGKTVREAVAEVTGGVGLVDVSERVPDASSGAHVAVVYAGSRTGAQDSDVDAEIKGALRNGLAVLPVIQSSAAVPVRDMLPDRIRQLNAVDWDDDRPLAIATILRLLGLVEDERRVFLSYVRGDSAKVAEQLHRELQKRQFDVFLDRFTVPPGDDFQRRLTEDLADKAFLLLLESDGIRDSQWVQYEINYALSHRIGVLAVTMPKLAKNRHAAVDEAFRLRLDASDLQNGQLKSETLRALLERIELSHASALRRRREQLLGSLIDHLEASGCSWDPLTEWAIIARATDHIPSAFQVVPRTPRVDDLRALDRERDRVQSSADIGNIGASLVHDVEHMAEDHADLLQWAGDPRGLAVWRILDVCSSGGNMTSLGQKCVFLSASFPSGERGSDFKPFDPGAIADAVTAVVRAVLAAEGRLLFGGHPNITPLVLMVASELGAKGAVDVFQSRWFEDQITRETRALQERGFGAIHLIPERATREESLQTMRMAMLGDDRKLIAGVFIGGMEGVLEEYELFHEFQPCVPRVSFVAPGGAAAKLPIAEASDVLGKHVASRHYPFVASVLIDRLARTG